MFTPNFNNNLLGIVVKGLWCVGGKNIIPDRESAMYR